MRRWIELNRFKVASQPLHMTPFDISSWITSSSQMEHSRYLGRGNDNRFSTRGPAKPVIHACPAAWILITAPRTARMITEPNVGCGRETLSVGSIQAGRASRIHCACPTTDILRPAGAVGHRDWVRGLGGEHVDGSSDEGELRVGRGEPLLHFFECDYVVSGLSNPSVSITTDILEYI